jgi:hypothetical protein
MTLSSELLTEGASRAGAAATDAGTLERPRLTIGRLLVRLLTVLTDPATDVDGGNTIDGKGPTRNELLMPSPAPNKP